MIAPPYLRARVTTASRSVHWSNSFYWKPRTAPTEPVDMSAVGAYLTPQFRDLWVPIVSASVGVEEVDYAWHNGTDIRTWADRTIVNGTGPLGRVPDEVALLIYRPYGPQPGRRTYGHTYISGLPQQAIDGNHWIPDVLDAVQDLCGLIGNSFLLVGVVWDPYVWSPRDQVFYRNSSNSPRSQCALFRRRRMGYRSHGSP